MNFGRSNTKIGRKMADGWLLFLAQGVHDDVIDGVLDDDADVTDGVINPLLPKSH